jgi:hypothetical protein
MPSIIIFWRTAPSGSILIIFSYFAIAPDGGPGGGGAVGCCMGLIAGEADFFDGSCGASPAFGGDGAADELAALFKG